MHEIESWLKEGKPWGAGMVLLSKYCSIKSLYNVLSRAGESKTTKAKLEGRLRLELNKLKQDVPATVVAEVPQPAKPVNSQKVNELNTAANKLYQQMGALHARILATPTVSGRKQLYEQITGIQKQWATEVFNRDYFEQHGELPAAPVKKVTNAKNLPGCDFAQLMLLRSKVTRAQNEQIPNYESKSGDTWKKKLEERLKDVERWKKQIAELESKPQKNG